MYQHPRFPFLFVVVVEGTRTSWAFVGPIHDERPLKIQKCQFYTERVHEIPLTTGRRHLRCGGAKMCPNSRTQPDSRMDFPLGTDFVNRYACLFRLPYRAGANRLRKIVAIWPQRQQIEQFFVESSTTYLVLCVSRHNTDL
jgi:hypothetical protein